MNLLELLVCIQYVVRHISSDSNNTFNEITGKCLGIGRATVAYPELVSGGFPKVTNVTGW